MIRSVGTKAQIPLIDFDYMKVMISLHFVLIYFSGIILK